ncbi:AAA family ATPase [Halomonas maura]|uniref:AAA family ATPase n=1 Tax=Halomonas maura TaxID=117606 RepID=UPI0025B2B6B1|nr:AAA family ATPase [Halomonas maura]MDN3554617.1 AAA family ATPase [Halomonas maura]
MSSPEFNDTEVGRFIESLSDHTNEDQVSELVNKKSSCFDPDKVREEVVRLKAQSPEAIVKELEGRKRQLEPLMKYLQKALDRFGDTRYCDIWGSKREYLDKAEIAKAVREKLLTGLPLSGVGSAEWQAMWHTAEKFVHSVNHLANFPPRLGEYCPLCTQEVDQNANDRLLGFYSLMADQTSKDEKDALEKYHRLRREYLSARFDLSHYPAAIALVQEYNPSFQSLLAGVELEIGNRLAAVESNEEPDPATVIPLDENVVNVVSSIIEGLGREIESVASRGGADEIIEEKEASIRDHEDRVLLERNADKVISNIRRFKAVAKYKKIESECKPRSITDLNTSICQEAVVQPLIEAFDDELSKFGFSRFKVRPKTRGRSGSQLLKLEVFESGEPVVANVASEGEQRCIAIACFLAEMRADERSSAIVFDDPVNSLSHQWAHKVVKRIVDESLERQVIVLTHDIVFYKMMLEECEKRSLEAPNQNCLMRSRRRAGIVRSSPPWDALTTSKRIQELKVMCRGLARVDADELESDFRRDASEFYGYLREAWERLIEERLLYQVVTRFGREIQTTRLRRLTDITDDDFARISKAMSKCSAYFRGHDTSPAVAGDFPSMDEVWEDLRDIEEYHKHLCGERKRS